jgi:hypothetical protein
MAITGDIASQQDRSARAHPPGTRREKWAWRLLLAVAGVAVRRAGGRGLWALLAGSVALLWFPHVSIAAVMVLNGS